MKASFLTPNITGIGVDTGKTEMAACIRCSDGTTEPAISFPNTNTGHRKFLATLGYYQITEAIPILLESTGPYHWQLASTLTTKGYLAKVVNPLHTKHMIRHSIRKRKTDPVDASHLAQLASQGYGYAFRETAELAQSKALVRHYWKLRSTLSQHKMHENYLQDYRGLTKLKKYCLSEPITKRSEALREEIVKQFSRGNDLRYLTSIPGISPILASTILAELRPLDRFGNLSQVVAYSGLDPAVIQSGGKAAHYGRLSKRGSPLLRRALYLSAFGCFASKVFKPVYQDYKAKGHHHTTVLCILARKLLRISVTLLQKRQVFDPSYLKSLGA